MQEIRMMLVVILTLNLASISMAYTYQGTATFYYPPYVPPACNGIQIPENLMIAAASDSIWDNRGACGRQYVVRCLGSTNKMKQPCKIGEAVEVLVTIVDYCAPPRCRGTINLSQEAFSKIAETDAGRILIEFEEFS